jgi:heat shock protein HtpX
LASSSIATRAALAIALMVGFYVLALAISGFLLWIPYAEYLYAERVHGRLLLFCVGGAGIVLWSIFPRPDRFEPPGPLLARDEHPQLFERLEGVARSTGQEMPAEVYLVPDVNAWVSQRGGVMGFGSRRVMGLGLPLMQVLNVSELLAVMAHEFGHFHGGDTKLGPWIYKTRAAIGRTLDNLAQHNSVLQWPFLWYGKMFLRVTHAISRRQEYTADELAASTVGARPLGEALKKICGAAHAFQPYFTSEYAPVLGAGYRTPLAEGFGRFIAAPSVAQAVMESIQREIAEGQADPYDTHPPLRERLEALKMQPAGDAGANGAPAISLLSNTDELETRLLSTAIAGADFRKCAPLRWEDIGMRIYLPGWMNNAREHAPELTGVTPAQLADVTKDLPAFGRKCFKKGIPPPAQQLAGLAVEVVGAALAVALYGKGFQFEVPLGEPIVFRRGDLEIKPFAVPATLYSGELAPDAWQAVAVQAGIAEIDLGNIPTSAAVN